MPVNLRNRHLISLKHHTPAEIEYLLDLAADLKNKKRAGIKGNLLERKNVALIFEKPSTRTRCAFTVAAIDEGGHPEYATVARVRLAGVELDAKDANKAKAAIDAIDPAQAQMPLVLDRRGDVLLALGDVEGARKCWEDALERDRASGELLALLSLKIQALPEKKS